MCLWHNALQQFSREIIISGWEDLERFCWEEIFELNFKEWVECQEME